MEVVYKKLGKLPAKGDTRLLAFARFAQLDKVPAVYDPWKKRTRFPARSFGNRIYGDCTRASQAVMMTRLERVEAKRTPVIGDEEVLRRYFEMTWRRYGGGADGSPMPQGWATPDGPGDIGAYEVDALSDWRNPATAIADSAGHPLTIDAFTSVNHRDNEEVKAAIALSGKFGIKICLNLPLAFSRIDPPNDWDVPAGQTLTGDWQPGSWGPHSLYAESYDRTGIKLPQTWYDGDVPYEQTLTWAAVAAYADEAHWVIDSIDGFRKRAGEKVLAAVDLAGLVKAVNKVSRTKIRNT